jgi:hypothetical protein
MKLKELSQLLIESIYTVTGNAFAENGDLPLNLSKAVAQRQHGRGNVDKWVELQLVNPAVILGKVSKKFYDTILLERPADSSYQLTYLPVAER